MISNELRGVKYTFENNELILESDIRNHKVFQRIKAKACGMRESITSPQSISSLQSEGETLTLLSNHLFTAAEPIIIPFEEFTPESIRINDDVELLRPSFLRTSEPTRENLPRFPRPKPNPDYVPSPDSLNSLSSNLAELNTEKLTSPSRKRKKKRKQVKVTYKKSHNLPLNSQSATNSSHHSQGAFGTDTSKTSETYTESDEKLLDITPSTPSPVKPHATFNLTSSNPSNTSFNN